jgi:hypothetical protein
MYRYCGSREIAQAVVAQPGGYPIHSVVDLENWMNQAHQQPNRWGLIEATFVVTEEGVLALADRHSEHVACAGGKRARSAGEMFFARGADGWEVQEVSNQSAGYCPEPESWLEVAAALEQVPLPHPGGFTDVCLFRRCPDCHQLNLIKEGVFVCAVCGAEVPQAWNCDNADETSERGAAC